MAARGSRRKRTFIVFRNGHVQYVTTLSPAQFCEPSAERGPECSPGSVIRIQVSPTGDHMAFLTASQITAYENIGFSEMYTYSPSSEELRCVSCLPSGEEPSSNVWASSDGIFMTNDGRAFFSTADAIAPRDTDGGRDVYEYVDGRAQLITSGISAKDDAPEAAANIRNDLFAAGLVGVSADGTNVYFSTYDSLVGQDQNGSTLKFYDARTDGGFPFVAPPAPCPSADECVGAGSERPVVPREASGADLGNGGNVGAGHASRRHRRKGKHRVSRGGHRRGGLKHG